MKLQKLVQETRAYYDRQRTDRNLILGKKTGIINHHFGIGDYHHPKFKKTPAEVTRVLNELELRQMDMLFCFMGPVYPSDVILDAGCGRGGTAITLNNRFGCAVHGISISPYQVNFAKRVVKEKGLSKRIHITEMDYHNLSFKKNMFDHVLTNESTEHSYSLEKLFKGFSRVLKPNGRYTLAAWCMGDGVDESKLVERANIQYKTNLHRPSEYLQALKKTGFAHVIKADLSEMAQPYVTLRKDWKDASGIEITGIDGFKKGEIRYYYFTATKTKN
ncbi:MAG: methyltransferase domain-containing protein [Candidatus Diapherotrites archaeon]